MVLRFPCKLQPAALSNSPTRVRLAWWPCCCSASASRRRLLQVYRNGDSGSPRVVGSTSASRSSTNVGSLTIAGLRPAPGRRTRAEGSSCANPSNPARWCSVPARLPSPPRQCHHNPRQMPRPRRPDDDPVRRETGLPSKTALGWVQRRSPPQHMVWERSCKPISYSIKSRFDNFLTGP